MQLSERKYKLDVDVAHYFVKGCILSLLKYFFKKSLSEHFQRQGSPNFTSCVKTSDY